MITKVTGKDFKGLNFEQALDSKTIICGPNGSGKSARSMALVLTALGYMPGSDKKNAAILAAFGYEKMNVGIEIDGVEFKRQWSMSAKGSVSQTYMAGGKRAKKDVFIAAMGKAGVPAVFDLGAFMDLSDQKKIDYLFDLFPPGGDVEKLQTEIETSQETLNTKRAEMKASEAVISRTEENRSEIELPAGTLAKVSADLQAVKSQLADAWDKREKQVIIEAEQAKEAEIEKKRIADEAELVEAARVEKLKAEEQAATNEPELESMSSLMKRRDQNPAAFDMPPQLTKISEGGYRDDTPASEEAPDGPIIHDLYTITGNILSKIIAAIESANCPACSNGIAMMVAKDELRKWKIGREAS